MTKQEEYDFMVVSKPQEYETTVGGKKIKWLKAWNIHNTHESITFKTIAQPPYIHKSMSYEAINLMPVRNLTIYKVTIKK